MPADFRERVFEPAMIDLWLDEAGREATPRGRWLARFVIIAECLRLGLPQYVWRRGRPTQLGGALAAAMLVVSLLVQRHNYARAAGMAPPRATSWRRSRLHEPR
jgi:hypothetical protein